VASVTATAAAEEVAAADRCHGVNVAAVMTTAKAAAAAAAAAAVGR